MKNITMTLQDEINELVNKTRQSEGYKEELFQSDLTIAFIKAMREKKIPQKDLAKQIGVKESYLSRIFSRESNLTLKTIRKLAEALDLEITVEPKKVNQKLYLGHFLPNQENSSLWNIVTKMVLDGGKRKTVYLIYLVYLRSCKY